MLRSLNTEFSVAIAAGEAAIRIDTDEVPDCLATLANVCDRKGWELRVFDPLSGVQTLTKVVKSEVKPVTPKTIKSPADLINAVGSGAPTTAAEALQKFWQEPPRPDLSGELENGEGQTIPVILVIRNFHLALERSRELTALTVQHIAADKIADLPCYKMDPAVQEMCKDYNIPPAANAGKFVVGLMPAETKLPPELTRVMKHLVHELPDENELLSILNDICPTVSTDDADDDMSHDTRKLIAKHSLGLTRTQAEGIYASCHVLHGKIDPAYVWKEKSLILNREGLVSLYTGKETFKDVAGLEGMKDFITRLLTPDRFNKDDESVRAKGILACGFPGVGKSLVAKAVGNELNLPVLMVNPSAWFGSYVGESEAKTRKGFQIIKAHAPCVAIIDEVEKVMPSSRGGKGDSGVGARMEGTFLTAMNDMTERVFWMFTANDVTNMHEAFFRAERVDATFYVKLPGPKQRAELWKLYGKKYYPPEVSVDGVMEPFPRYVSTDLKLALEKLKAATLKKPADIVQWGEKLVLPLLCLGSEEAVKAAMESIRKISAEVADAIEKFSDDGWSPAEIQACCRLSRVVGESLTATSKRIRPLSLSSPKILDKLEEWAECSALDAETGRLFTRESLDGGPDGTDVGMDNASPVKRKRKLRKA